jgi:hypothetical protein
MRPIIVKGIHDWLALRNEAIEDAIAEDSQSIDEKDTYPNITELFDRRVEDARRLCAGSRRTRRL